MAADTLFRTRFAPSPTGPLHLGHAYSAMLAHDLAVQNKGEFLLRIEDIDQSRARTQWEDWIFRDLKALGIEWPKPVLRQSGRLNAYRNAIQSLWDKRLIYPCTCNRRDILDAASAPQEGAAPIIGPDGVVYPGTCRNYQHDVFLVPPATTLRLDMRKAIAHLATTDFAFIEQGQGTKTTVDFSADKVIDKIGDIVIARTGLGTSYHLSVVLDDAFQKISHVVRGQDLFEATKIHVILQKLFNLPTPVYHHHKLIRDKTGKRLAKRHDAEAIRKYLDNGATAGDIRKQVGLRP
ncbi:tRNA glutamyl-Q(34) synthetase GluQRS [Sulfitobacter sp. 1151]|uniref:tRNA glutamyl-Q(34) synthetase GluQRS n=2 Tax=Parasulfitobacter algicola TaxID=2614809 RepID=A0ABX2IRH9_9RHOB|nr:tRNA glutamyl-Q(34) synthetase GluQRS [Sulfitobacter algicola]